jgi:hypothetical protein
LLANLVCDIFVRDLSAREIIELIKTLPPEEQVVVVKFVVAQHAKTPAPKGRPDSDAEVDLFRMGDYAMETGIPDLATNADHYLYGHPKVTHAG